MGRRYGTAIVGAGPYGLSLAAHLCVQGVPHRIFGKKMGSWRHNMPADMVLRSEAFASTLWDPQRRYTFEAFCGEKGFPYLPVGLPVTLSRFVEYAAWFERRTAPAVEDAQLVKLSRKLGGFILEFSNGDAVPARNVIVATGNIPFRYVPSVLADLPDHLVSHSSDHDSLRHFRDKHVIVVGGGQSALETGALLHEYGARVRVLARRARIIWNSTPPKVRSILRTLRSPDAGLGPGWISLAISELPQAFFQLPRPYRHEIVAKSWGPSGAWWLRDRVVDKVPVLTSHEIMRASEHGNSIHLVVRAAGEKIEFEADHVIAATGFQRDLARLPFLGSDLLSDITGHEGIPTLSRAYESSVPNLFFIGHLAAPSFGPVMRFMYGAKHAAGALARRLGAEYRYRSPTYTSVAVEGN